VLTKNPPTWNSFTFARLTSSLALRYSISLLHYFTFPSVTLLSALLNCSLSSASHLILGLPVSFYLLICWQRSFLPCLFGPIWPQASLTHNVPFWYLLPDQFFYIIPSAFDLLWFSRTPCSVTHLNTPFKIPLPYSQLLYFTILCILLQMCYKKNRKPLLNKKALCNHRWQCNQKI
jgi:hypothetical protein